LRPTPDWAGLSCVWLDVFVGLALSRPERHN
jgi:hypothetical protein